MPKVLFHICDGIYPSVVGGMEIFNYYLIKNLSPDVAVFSSRKYDFDTEHIRYRKIRPTKIFDGIQLFWTLLRHRDIRTVVFSYSEAHWLLWYMNYLAVKLAGRRYVSVIHHGKVPPKDNIEKLGKFLKNSFRVIAVSDDIKRNYDEAFGINCTVIPPLIPFSVSELSKEECRRNYGIDNNAYLICQVGTIKEMKNPQTIIEAISLFSDQELKKYNPHIVFAGNNLMQDKLEELVKEKGLESRVHFIGFVPVEDVRDVMRMSDQYVISSDYEGTSVSLLEAMFNSMPIAASDVRGINGMISDWESALMFPVKNAYALKNVLLEMLDSEELRFSLGRKAKSAYIAKYDYLFILKTYRRLLES